MIVVLSLVTTTLRAEPSRSSVALSSLRPTVLGDDLTAGQHGDVLEGRLAALTEAGRLDGDRGERATDLVDHQGREGLALDVLGDDQQRTARLHDLLEHRHEVLDRGDLALVQQDVRVLEDGLLALGVGHEVRRQVALVELHALGELEVEAEGVRLLDGDHAVLADLVDRLGDDVADGGSLLAEMVATWAISERSSISLARPLRASTAAAHGSLDALLQGHRVGAGGHVAQTFTHEGLGQHGRGGGAVTGDVVGLGGHLLDELGAHVLVGVVELDLTSDGHTVVRDGRGAELLVEDHVAALRADRDLDRVGQLVHAGLEATACFFVELQDLGHLGLLLGELREDVTRR